MANRWKQGRQGAIPHRPERSGKTLTDIRPPSADLTEGEGTFLALLERVQPTTAYALAKIYARSPVSNFGTSKGKIYPMIERLERRGLLKRRRIEPNQRKAELLECTREGVEAVRAWTIEIRPSSLLLDDPLRTRVQSFGLLSPKERLEWIVDAKEGLAAKLRELEEYAEQVTVPFHKEVHDNATSSVRSRMEWLDRLLAAIVRAQ